MELKKLPKEVSSLLRTGVIITCPSQCVAELVTNSIDAGANSIAVRVDFRTYKIQVIDNGIGISKKNLECIGKRYMTSKCKNLNDLQEQLDKFGFKGEAIASLREVSSLLTISSRAQNCRETYSKVIVHGKNTSVGLTSEQRPSHGTTVTVQDFLYNMPVRRKRINEALDIEEIKLQLESLALVHPEISFSLRNDANGKLLLHTKKSRNTVEIFRTLFGSQLANSLTPLEHTEGNIEISGYIGKEVHQHKTLQFFYINKRFVVKTKFHKLINMILGKSFLLRANGPWSNLPIPKDMNEKFGMPMNKKSKHAIFVINLKCPYAYYDITLDPRKTQVQFKDWSEVLQCLENAVKKFLEAENLTVPSVNSDGEELEKKEDNLDSPLEIEEDSAKEGTTTKRKHFPTPHLHIPRAVHGLPAKRHKSLIKSIWPPAEPDVTLSETNSKGSIEELSVTLSDDTETETEDPVPKTLRNIETIYTNGSKVKGKSKQKQGKNKDKIVLPGQTLLPDHFNKLKIFHLASNTVKKSFSHHTQIFLNEPTKNDRTKFPLFTKMARECMESKSKDQACQTSETPVMKAATQSSTYTSKFSHSSDSCVQDQQETCIVGDVEVSPEPSSPMESCVASCSQTYLPPSAATVLPSLSYSSNVAKSGYIRASNENVQSAKQLTDQDSYMLDGIRNVLSQVFQDNSEPSLINPVYDLTSTNVTSNCQVPEYKDANYLHDKTSLRDEHSLNEHYQENITSHPALSCELQEPYEVEYFTEKPTSCEPQEPYEVEYFTEKPTNHLSRRKYCSEIYASSSSGSSVDDFSEENFKKLKEKIEKPLKDISKDINETRLRFSQDISIFNPELSSINMTINDSRDNVMDSPINKSPISKIHSLLQFSHKSKPRYKPSFYKEPKLIQTSESIKISESSFTQLDKYVSELENLTKKPYLKPRRVTHEEQLSIRENREYLNNEMLLRDRMSEYKRRINKSHTQTAAHKDCQERTSSHQSPTESLFHSASKILQCFDPNVAPVVDLNYGFTNVQAETAVAQPSEGILDHDTYPHGYNTFDFQQAEDQYMRVPRETSLAPKNIWHQDVSPLLSNTPNQFSDYCMTSYGTNTPTLTSNSVESHNQIQEQVEDSFTTMEYSPSLPRSQHLVPYSSSSGSDEMDITTPGWSSIVNVPNADESNKTNCLFNFNSSTVYSNQFLSSVQNKENVSNTDGNALSIFENSTVSEQNFHMGGSSIIPETVTHFAVEGRTQHFGMNEDNSADSKNATTVEKSDTIAERSVTIVTEANVEEPLKTTNDSVSKEISDASRHITKEPPIMQLPVQEEALKENDTTGVSEWQERNDPSGRKYYLNSKTGVTTYDLLTGPQFDFSMTPRHFFMPKGASPVLAIPSGRPGPETEPLNAEEQAQLQEAVKNNNSLEQHLASVKWTKLAGDKPSEFAQMVQKMLSDIENAVHYEGRISNACENAEATIKVYNVLNQYKFNKDMLSTFKILGQWDDKFILTAVSMQNEREPHLIVLFDQHAVHERVRLERLTKEYQSNPTTGHFRSDKVCPPLCLHLSEREVCILLSFREQFERLGLKYEALNNTDITVNHVPTCFKLRDERQRSSRGRCLDELVTNLVSEQVQTLLQTRGVGARIPSSLQSVLNSEACTGAVKFGDSLTSDDCHMLLSCLAQCTMPFQCAHGRPVLAPIVDLKHMNRNQYKLKKPKLFGALERLKSKLEE